MAKRLSVRLSVLALFALAVALPVVWAFPPEKPFDPRPVTEAAAKKLTEDKYTFLVLGDSRANPVFKLLMEKAQELKPGFALLTGDQVRDGQEKEYDSVAQQLEPFARTMGIWPCYGNHDSRNPAAYEKFFGMKEKHYSFDFRNARVIGFEAQSSAATTEKAELEWLEKQLEEGKKAGKMLFLWQHGPAYTVGEKMEVANKPCAVTALCEKYGVVADFAGHDHIYYRTKRNNINYIVQGVGGAPIYRLKRTADAVPGDVWWGGSAKKQWVLHNAQGDKTMDQHVFLYTAVTVDGAKVTGKTMTHDGDVIDEFVLREGK